MTQPPTLNDLKAVTSQLSVLYVEDEAMLREGLQSSLRQLFGNVEVAEDGAIGLALYENAQFDLIITDISMPNMDGITMIRKIKEHHPQAHIIVTSAQNDSDRLLELINLGVDRFLTKPIGKIALIEALYSIGNMLIAIKQAEAYRRELEQKVRLLNTYIKKDSLKAAATSTNPVLSKKEEEHPHQDYHEHLLDEELDELRDLNEELDHDILLAFQNNRIDLAYVTRLSNRYERYGAILARHHAFIDIGVGLHSMAREFSTHQQTFIERLSSIRELLESFNFTLITFRKNVLEKHSHNPTFYNASLLSDIAMIQNLLNQTEIDGDIEFF
ncbi:MAG: response regulator [Sulfuricurvum sp.]|nr:response regulator [Sulfuricurvum sp.]